MADEGAPYETKTVRSVRGLESRTITKWEGDGWEFVSQTPGKLQTEILFRRPTPKSRTPLYVIGGVGAAVVLAIVIGIGVYSERNGAEDTVPSVTTPAAVEPTSSEPDTAATAEETTAESTEPSAAVTEPEVLTPESNAELNALLSLTDQCDSSIGEFADEFQGRTVSFDGSIGAMNPHDGATTRYDILIGAGDFSETTAPGPAFQFRDVNTTGDLRYEGDVPDSIGVGTNLHVTAKVGRYESESCLFLLEPVEIAF